MLVPGAVTMLLGGWRALRQTDLKLLLAYGTVSQLGFLTVLVGAGTRGGRSPASRCSLAHALFKAALFLVVGIVDHATGTRDLRRAVRARPPPPLVSRSSPCSPPPRWPACRRCSDSSPRRRFRRALVGALRRPDGRSSSLVVLVARLGAHRRPTRSVLVGGVRPKPRRSIPRRRLAPAGARPGRRPPCSPCRAGARPRPGLSSRCSPVRRVPGRRRSRPRALARAGSALPLSAISPLGGRPSSPAARRSPAASAGTRRSPADQGYGTSIHRLDRVAVEVTGVTQRGSLPVYLGRSSSCVLACRAPLLAPRPWPVECGSGTPRAALVGVVVASRRCSPLRAGAGSRRCCWSASPATARR